MKRTNVQTIAIITFLIILVGIGAYMTLRKGSTELKTYSNQNYGITFQYPEKYELTETAVTEGQTGTVVTLTEKGLTVPTGGEGPTAITIAMYEGTGTTTVGNKDPLLTWIRTSPYSNFTLSSQTDPGITTVGEKDARLYTWDGLYQGTTVAAMNKGNIIIMSVTYDGEADLAKREDFTDLIASVKFIDATDTQATSTPPTANTSTNSVNDSPKKTTLSGTYECLPHKNLGEVQTLECAFGIKADNGNHYALDLGSISPDLANTEMNVRIRVTGLLVPIEQISTDVWQKYNIRGIMKVDTFVKA